MKSLSDQAIDWADYIRKEVDFPNKKEVADLLMNLATRQRMLASMVLELQTSNYFKEQEIVRLNVDCGK